MIHEGGREERGRFNAGNDETRELGKHRRLTQIPMAFNRDSRQTVRVSEVVECRPRKMKLHGIAGVNEFRRRCPVGVDIEVFGSVDLWIGRNIQQPPLLHADRVEMDCHNQPWQMNVVNRRISCLGARQQRYHRCSAVLL